MSCERIYERSRGPMARRSTTNREIQGSNPCEIRFFFFFWELAVRPLQSNLAFESPRC